MCLINPPYQNDKQRQIDSLIDILVQSFLIFFFILCVFKRSNVTLVYSDSLIFLTSTIYVLDDNTWENIHFDGRA